MKTIFSKIIAVSITILAAQIIQAQCQVGGTSCPNPFPPQPPPMPSGDVFNPYICQGQPITGQDAARYFRPGDSEASLGNFGVYGRIRICNKLSGCGGWVSKPVTGYSNSGPNPVITFINFKLKTINETPYFSYYSKVTDSTVLTKNSNGLYIGSGYTLINGQYVSAYIGSVKSNCSWFLGNTDSGIDSSGSWSENQIAIYGTH